MKTFSFAILLACTVMMVVEIVMAHGFVSLEENPMLGPDAYTLALLGSSYGWRMQTKWELYRLFSPIFLHGGIFHLLMNGMFLIFFGVPLEQKWGWRWYSSLFFISGIGASLFSTVVHPDVLGVGASGALFGLMGGAIADVLVHWSSLDPQVRKMQLIQLVAVAVLWMIISFGSKYIDGWAHLGGLIYGFLAALAYWLPESQSRPLVTRFGRPAVAGFTVTGTLIMAGLFWGGVVKTTQIFPPVY